MIRPHIGVMISPAIEHTVTIDTYSGFDERDPPLFAARCSCGIEAVDPDSGARAEATLDWMHDSGWAPPGFSESDWGLRSIRIETAAV